MKLVTPFTFNFFSWLLGFSEDAQACEYVEVDEKHAARVFSVCQDLINISSKGKIQTPKSLALAMAVGQITGCSKLINILNGLGHCVSLSSTMAFDSALAQLTINTSNIIPRNFVAEEYIKLVFDNIDFGEEISKQTHVTNGITTQKITIQNECELRHSTVIKSHNELLKFFPASFRNTILEQKNPCFPRNPSRHPTYTEWVKARFGKNSLQARFGLRSYKDVLCF